MTSSQLFLCEVEGKQKGQASHRTIIAGPTNDRHKKEDKKYIRVFVRVLHICRQLGWDQLYKTGKSFITASLSKPVVGLTNVYQGGIFCLL